jgi:HAMP domain-containing protein
MVIALGAASLIIIAYGFSRTQDDATHLSREGLEEQGKLILAALAGGSAESGGLQLESAAEAGQRSTRYLEDYKAANGEVAPVDTSEFEQTSEGVWYDPDPNRASDIVVINGASPEDNEVAYDLAYSAPLEPLLPALSEGFPGEFAADAYHPIAITYIGISGAARYYPPIGIEETTPPGLDLSNLYDEYGPISNPNRETIWTSPYQDIVGQFVITAQTPVYDGDDFRGIFQVDLSINELLDQVNGIRPTANSFAFYVDTDGEILQTDAYSLLTSEAQDNPELAAILDTMTNPSPDDGISVDSVTLAGNEYFLAHGAMPSVGGGFAVAAPVDELSEQAALITSEIDDEASRSFGLMVIAMSALFVAALIGVTYLNSGLLLAPLRRLSEGTRAVAAGDLDTKVDLQRGDELGMLADSFNSMVEQLRESERHLERQVEERTAELRAMIEISRSLASAQNLRALVETILAPRLSNSEKTRSKLSIRSGLKVANRTSPAWLRRSTTLLASGTCFWRDSQWYLPTPAATISFQSSSVNSSPASVFRPSATSGPGWPSRFCWTAGS